MQFLAPATRLRARPTTGRSPSLDPPVCCRHPRKDFMDRTKLIVCRMFQAIEAPLYDIGALSARGMLPGLDGLPATTVLEKLPLLKHAAIFPKLLGTFAAQTLAARYGADPSAADCRRFGRLPGFTNCKPKYRKPDGLFPFVQLRSQTGQQYPMAETFEQEITRLYEAREQERQARRLQASLSPRRGPRSSNLSLERFRTSGKYHDRPAAADIAFCVAAYASGMDELRMERALEDDYLSRDPSPAKRAAYIRRTMTKARDWANR